MLLKATFISALSKLGYRLYIYSVSFLPTGYIYSLNDFAAEMNEYHQMRGEK